MILHGRAIVSGEVEGEILKFDNPIVILGDINEKNGTIMGRDIRDKIVVFPKGVGSTVGSYTIYGLRYYNNAPKAFILEEAETIVAAGAIMANIPLIDKIDISNLHSGSKVAIKNNIVEII